MRGSTIFEPLVPLEARRELLGRFTKTARRIRRGVRMEFADDLHAGQIAWPEACPLSEAEVRGEIEALYGEVKTIYGELEALRNRARKLYDKLPEPPDAEFKDEVPRSIYYALTDAVSMIMDTPEDALSYVEDLLAETPERLRRQWLRSQVEKCLDVINDPESDEPLEKLVSLLCGEEVEAAGEPAGD